MNSDVNQKLVQKGGGSKESKRLIYIDLARTDMGVCTQFGTKGMYY